MFNNNFFSTIISFQHIDEICPCTKQISMSRNCLQHFFICFVAQNLNQILFVQRTQQMKILGFGVQQVIASNDLMSNKLSVVSRLGLLSKTENSFSTLTTNVNNLCHTVTSIEFNNSLCSKTRKQFAWKWNTRIWKLLFNFNDLFLKKKNQTLIMINIEKK